MFGSWCSGGQALGLSPLWLLGLVRHYRVVTNSPISSPGEASVLPAENFRLLLPGRTLGSRKRRAGVYVLVSGIE